MATPSQPPPAMLGRYRIVRRLGAGGMAEVFLAKSTGAEGIEKLLVVKRILPTFARSAKFLTMFVDEAKVATRLNHPCIVQVYGFEQVRDEFLLAMEFVDGLDLGRLISAARRRGQTLPFGISAFAVQEIAKGLDYAHNRKDEHGEPMEIVHRDVSPQNVLLSYEGTVKVADFGIARARLVSEETGVIKGKFSYMSPEQARGERVDRRSDVYSLGVLLAELLMNRVMYPGQHGLDVLEQVRQGRLTLPRAVEPSVPPELEDIVRRATSYDVEERYQTCRSLAGALGQWLHAQEEVYDAEKLERFIAEVAPREITSPDAGRGSRADRPEQTAATLVSAAGGDQKDARERRHVVVVSGVVRGEDPQQGMSADVARVLSDIAYKVDGYYDSQGGNRFRIVLGLLKPTVQDALEAIRVASDVVDALQGLSADRLQPVSASLGVSRGIVVTVRDPTGKLKRTEPVGSVLEIADRLAQSGDPGEVLAAGEVHRLTRRTFAYDDKAPREISVATQSGSASVSRGIRAHRLRGGRTREERADVLVSDAVSSIVGRREEIGTIVEAYQEAVSARRSAYVAVIGDLGIGKTALIAAALDSMDPAPRILRTECVFGQDVPFAATAELVREACGIGDDATPDEARARLRAAVHDLVPDGETREATVEALEPLVAPSSENPAPDGDHSRLVMVAVRNLLGALSLRGPLVIWLDALQWADAPSLGLVAEFFERTYEVPLLGIASTRPDPRVQQVIRSVPQLEIDGLEPEAVSELLQARFDGATVPADIEQLIVERADPRIDPDDGLPRYNPFFLVEIVEALLERGAVRIEGEGDQRRVARRPGGVFALPTTLEGVIAARLGELPEEERRALRWLAVAGPGFRAADLGNIAGMDLGPQLESLERRGLAQKRAGGAYAFPSAVIRHVAYESADVGDRVRMHKRVASHLAQLQGVPPARIARHLDHAGDRAAAAEAYLAAAAAARAVYSNREALRFYARALALLPGDSPKRFGAHEAREQMLRGMGRRRDQIRELEAMRAFAERAGDAAMRALVYNRLARYELDQSRTPGVEALLRRALAAAIECGDDGSEIEALRLQSQLARDQGDPQGALVACDRALALAGLRPDRLSARGAVLLQRGILLRRLGRLDEALEADAEAVVIFHRLGHKRSEAQALNTLGVCLSSLGAFEDAITVIRASIKLDREMGDRFHLGMKLSNVGQLYAELGDTERARSFLERALEVFEALDDHTGRSDALAAISEIAMDHENDLDAASISLDEARIVAERLGDRYDLARERLVRAAYEISAGHLEEADACVREAMEHAKIAGLAGFELLGLALGAEVQARLGQHDRARETAARAREAVKKRGTVERAERIHAAIARALELIGERESAASAYRDARALVDARLEQIRSPEMRERYLATPPVRAIRAKGNDGVAEPPSEAPPAE